MYLTSLLSSILILTIMSTISTTALAYDNAKILAATQTVVMIRGYNEDGGLAYGSGVVIAKNKVVSNCHVFRTTKKPWVARGEDTYTVKSIQADRYRDMCILTVDNLPLAAAGLGDIDELKYAEPVLSIGHSHGAPAPLTSMGEVKAKYPFQRGTMIKSTAQFRMGASGSGLFNMRGELIGINTFKTPGRRAYFYSLPIAWIAEILKEEAETTFPIDGRTFWEEEDVNKPFFMQVALPRIHQQWPKLKSIAEQWTDKEPNTAEAWFELGLANTQLENIAEAEKCYQQVIKLAPGNLEALFKLGQIAKDKGDDANVEKIKALIAEVDAAKASEFNQI